MTTPKDHDTYMIDPDEQVERLGRVSSEPVQASDYDDATQQCEDLADSYGVTLEGVDKRGDDWYDCNFRG
jgi:hypothetical protein